MTLGVALGWHSYPWQELLRLVRRAESLGYQAVYVDGDVRTLARRKDAEVLDDWTATTALLAQTERIPVGSIRLVQHWNAARLAQAAATAERIAPGRLRFLISIGGQPQDAHFGLAPLAAGERIRWLDEALDVVRALWRGEEVTFHGRYVQVEGARVRPTPPAGRIPIAVAGQGARLLEVVARHADAWEVNLPPLAERVARAAAHLEDACARVSRDPAEIRRSMWIFVRTGDLPRGEIRSEFRRFNPWFADLSDAEVDRAAVAGPAEHCLERLAEIRRELCLDLPVIDLSGLEPPAAQGILDALAPQKRRVDSTSSTP